MVPFLLLRGGLASSMKLVSDLAFILSTKISVIPSAMPITIALGMVKASSLKFATTTHSQLVSLPVR